MNRDLRLQLLHRARDLIETGRQGYICHALGRAYRNLIAECRDVAALAHEYGALRDIIEDGLWSGGMRFSALSGWMLHQLDYFSSDPKDIPEPYRAFAISESHSQHLRLAWLDKLIYDTENAS